MPKRGSTRPTSQKRMDAEHFKGNEVRDGQLDM